MKRPIITALLLFSASVIAKPAMDDAEYRACLKKLEQATQNAEDSKLHTTHCHYFGEPCRAEWRREKVKASFPSITSDPITGALIDQTSRLLVTARNIADQCMDIIDRKGLE